MEAATATSLPGGIGVPPSTARGPAAAVFSPSTLPPSGSPPASCRPPGPGMVPVGVPPPNVAPPVGSPPPSPHTAAGVALMQSPWQQSMPRTMAGAAVTAPHLAGTAAGSALPLPLGSVVAAAHPGGELGVGMPTMTVTPGGLVPNHFIYAAMPATHVGHPQQSQPGTAFLMTPQQATVAFAASGGASAVLPAGSVAHHAMAMAPPGTAPAFMTGKYDGVQAAHSIEQQMAAAAAAAASGAPGALCAMPPLGASHHMLAPQFVGGVPPTKLMGHGMAGMNPPQPQQKPQSHSPGLLTSNPDSDAHRPAAGLFENNHPSGANSVSSSPSGTPNGIATGLHIIGTASAPPPGHDMSMMPTLGAVNAVHMNGTTAILTPLSANAAPSPTSMDVVMNSVNKPVAAGGGRRNHPAGGGSLQTGYFATGGSGVVSATAAPMAAGGPDVGGRVGGGAQGPLDIGAHLIVKLCTGEVCRGELFAFDDSEINCVVLKEVGALSPNTIDFRLINLKAIVELNVTSLPPRPTTESLTLPVFSTEVLEKRESQAVADFEARRHTVGIHVTKEAQEIFDFIHKTHPDCRWTDGGEIVVMGIRVPSPYDVCIGPEGKAVQRMQEVLTRFRQRRQRERERSAAAAAMQQFASATGGSAISGMPHHARLIVAPSKMASPSASPPPHPLYVPAPSLAPAGPATIVVPGFGPQTTLALSPIGGLSASGDQSQSSNPSQSPHSMASGSPAESVKDAAPVTGGVVLSSNVQRPDQLDHHMHIQQQQAQQPQHLNRGGERMHGPVSGGFGRVHQSARGTSPPLASSTSHQGSSVGISGVVERTGGHTWGGGRGAGGGSGAHRVKSQRGGGGGAHRNDPNGKQ